MSNKFEEISDLNYEKRKIRKEKRKAKREKFAEEHPKIADAMLKTEVTLGVLLVFAIPYFAGRSSKYEEVKNNAEMDGYLKATNEFGREYSREDRDFIDHDGKYHQDLHFGSYAVWENCEAYLNAERSRLEELSELWP